MAGLIDSTDSFLFSYMFFTFCDVLKSSLAPHAKETEHETRCWLWADLRAPEGGKSGRSEDYAVEEWCNFDSLDCPKKHPYENVRVKCLPPKKLRLKASFNDMTSMQSKMKDLGHHKRSNCTVASCHRFPAWRDFATADFRINDAQRRHFAFLRSLLKTWGSPFVGGSLATRERCSSSPDT